MKAFFLILALLSTQANAQIGGGTYCSARTADGNWGFSFGPYPAAANCSRVRRGLAQLTSTPVTDVKRGYYNTNGINRVFINCGFHNKVITSTGAYALQNAYVTAASSGFTHCLFFVNNF